MDEENLKLIADAARTVTADIKDYEPKEVIELDNFRDYCENESETY